MRFATIAGRKICTSYNFELRKKILAKGLSPQRFDSLALRHPSRLSQSRSCIGTVNRRARVSPLHKSAPTPFHEEAEGNRRKRCRPRFRFGDRSEGDHIIPIVVIEAVVGTSCIFSRWIFPRPEKPQRETATDTISRAFGITTKPSASRKAEIFRPSRCACIAKTARRKMKL